MRQKADSCFSLCSSRISTLWRQGYPPVQYGVKLVQFNDIRFSNNQSKFLASNSTYTQGMHLVSDGKYIILENLKLEQYSLQNKKFLSISTNLDSIHMTSTNELMLQQLYENLKLYTIQDEFEKKYKTMKLMGKGSFAKVFQVMQYQNKQYYAVKIFNKAKMEVNEENDLSLWKEIGLMRQMNHRSVIKLHEVYEDDKKVYLVLDYLKGGDLLANLSNQVKVYDEQIVLKLIKNVLEALSYIHKLKILHRDLKPDNLILRNREDITDPVLVDFGLADFYSETGDYLFKDCGSIGYVAPEMLRNQKYDYKVDIFSLGVICYLLLTGQQAFEGDSTKRIFENNKKCNIDYAILAKCQVSDEAKDFCQLLLTENPLKRPDAETAMKHKWLSMKSDSLHKIPLRINKKPTIIRGQNEFIHSQSPLWVITSVKCISEDVDDFFLEKTQNVRDKTIDEILSATLKKWQLNSEYDLEDDVIEEDEQPINQVKNHQLLVKQRSLP